MTSSHRYAGAQFNTLEMNLVVNQAVQLSVGVISKATSLIQKTVPSFPGSPTDPFVWSTTSLQLGGAANAAIEALTVKVPSAFKTEPASPAG